jgi:hypothetical protein
MIFPSQGKKLPLWLQPLPMHAPLQQYQSHPVATSDFNMKNQGENPKQHDKSKRIRQNEDVLNKTYAMIGIQ